MKLTAERSLLSRVLEPEVMDTSDDARDYDAMDHAAVNRSFVADFLTAVRQAAVPADVEVLDLGTGTARIPIELCAQHPQARVLAIDLAENMLRLARANVAGQGLSERIALERMDAKRLPFPDASFAAVMSNSIVHHIPQPRGTLAAALRVLKSPGGLIFVRDLSRPYDERQVRELVDTYAAGTNDHQHQLFEASLRAALSLEEIRDLVAQFGMDPVTVQATSDRHWTWSAVKQ
jgi:ubiquinone/menaquinone biosynthesis C-methylase UbiE